MKASRLAVVLLLPTLALAFQNVRPITFSVQPPRVKHFARDFSSIRPTNLILSADASAGVVKPSLDDGQNNPNGDKNDDGQTGKIFEPLGHGIIRDYKARLPLFASDIKDGINVQCLAATMFLFFACLAPAIGFGGLFGMATNGAIGTMEMVSSTAFCGIVYALTAVQPMTIIGSTGPVLAFVATMAQLASSLKLPFLPLYAWTGLWTSAILFGSAITSGSNLVRYLTRFTDEIFSTLISAIFVVEAFSDVAKTFTSPASTFVKALLSVGCATTTYVLAMTLKKLKNSVFFNKRIRATLSQFGPSIGVITATLLARWARIAQGDAVAGLPSLAMPSTFATTSGRPWLVPLLELPVWARWGAVLPALMATVLLYLDQNITVRLVNNPRWKMTKGRRKGNVLDGMHGDMLVISILTAFQSILGIPWLVAATVRSLSHVNACTKNEDGIVEGVVEQRVTGVAIHTLIGCCVLFRKPRQLLTNVPLSVLMGLFCYLGISSLPGNELWERTIGFFKDPSVAPKERWTDKVPQKVTRLYTVIQLGCLAAMFGVKSSPAIGVLFPVVIAMLAPLRFALEKTGVVEKKYMGILDED